MRKRPLVLTALGVLSAAIVVGLPTQIMLRFGASPWDVAEIADKLAPLNWFVMAAAGLLSFLLFRGSSHVRFVAPAFFLLVVWNNWLVAVADPGVDRDIVIFSTIAVAGALSLLFLPDIRALLANPGPRWWATPERKRISVRARVRPIHGGELIAKTFDISQGGAFISMNEAMWTAAGKASAKKLEIGSHCSLLLDLTRYRTVNCVVRVVRHAEPRGQYPGGFAVQFEGLLKRDRRALDEFLREQGLAPLPVVPAPVKPERLGIDDTRPH